MEALKKEFKEQPCLLFSTVFFLIMTALLPFSQIDFTFNLLELIDDSSSLDESKTPIGLIKDLFVHEKTQKSVFSEESRFSQ